MRPLIEQRGEGSYCAREPEYPARLRELHGEWIMGAARLRELSIWRVGHGGSQMDECSSYRRRSLMAERRIPYGRASWLKASSASDSVGSPLQRCHVERHTARRTPYGVVAAHLGPPDRCPAARLWRASPAYTLQGGGAWQALSTCCFWPIRLTVGDPSV